MAAMAIAVLLATADPPQKVGVAKCGNAALRQGWKTLREGLAPIAAADGRCCVTSLSCLDCGPSCSLTCVPCNASDIYQLFEYNASTGAVVVPDAAAPQCAKHGRPARKGPWCWNLFANARKPGTAIDAFPCGYPTSDALLGPGKKAGTVELRDADTLCLSTGAASAWPPPPPAPPPPPPPPPPDPALDCALRVLALEVATERISRGGAHGPRNLRSVWDSLEFPTACPASPPPRPGAARRPVGPATLPTDALYVDWASGLDSNSGAVGAPLKTVENALLRSIADGPTPRAIVLRHGTHPLRSTLEIGPAHSGLHLTAYPGEQAILSGGAHLSLDFSSKTINGIQALVATIPDSVPREHFTELFVEDGNDNALNQGGLSRYTKARWPDGDPETDAGLCTTVNGCKAYSTASGSCGSIPFVNGVSTRAPLCVFSGSLPQKKLMHCTDMDRDRPAPLSAAKLLASGGQLPRHQRQLYLRPGRAVRIVAKAT